MEVNELENLVACAELRNPKQYSANRERYIVEISYKAGQEKGYLIGLHSGIYDGRKDVVDWVSDNIIGFEPTLSLLDSWYRQQREWGI